MYILFMNGSMLYSIVDSNTNSCTNYEATLEKLFNSIKFRKYSRNEQSNSYKVLNNTYPPKLILGEMKTLPSSFEEFKDLYPELLL